MSERDKYLTEATGECWHEDFRVDGAIRHSCHKCGDLKPFYYTNFSTWAGFGKLWEWAKGQEWFCLMMAHNGCGPHDIVNPDLFANEVCKFLTKEATKP